MRFCHKRVQLLFYHWVTRFVFKWASAILLFSYNSDRKKVESVVSFMHEKNIICSQTQLDDIVHEKRVICWSHGGLSTNEKEETFASNDNIIAPLKKNIFYE